MSLVENIAIQPTIASALQAASQRTGVEFDYLLKTAMRESSLDCDAKSKTSSACGLFQFTEQSWLGTLKKYGAELGFSAEAAKISTTPQGRFHVENAAQGAEILALRNDPHVSALMAAAYTQESASLLENRLGRSAGEGELYMAHFLGAGGAAKLITAAEETPDMRADLLFPAAAAANRPIFYQKDGTPRSAEEVYRNLVSKHEGVDTTRLADAANRPVPQKPVGRSAVPEPSGGEARRNYATRGAILAATHGGSAPAPAAGVGRAPLKLTSTIVEILASLDPMARGGEMERSGATERNEESRERRDARREREAVDLRAARAYHRA